MQAAHWHSSQPHLYPYLHLPYPRRQPSQLHCSLARSCAIPSGFWWVITMAARCKQYLRNKFRPHRKHSESRWGRAWQPCNNCRKRKCSSLRSSTCSRSRKFLPLARWRAALMDGVWANELEDWSPRVQATLSLPIEQATRTHLDPREEKTM